MKPSSVLSILDLSKKTLEAGRQIVPLFQGPPGIAKSQVCQQWAFEQNRLAELKGKKFGLIEHRLAYYEAPDMIGFPSVEIKDGVQVTVHNTPESWPQDPNWEGLILFEEPNRGTTAIMNTMMQILTDRTVGKYKLPKGAILAACINPEDIFHDVNTMDTALKNRFVIFNIEYDKKDFIRYMKHANFHSSVINYVEANVFKYRKPEDVGNKKGDQYNSPRSLEALSNVLKADVDPKLQTDVFEAILGKSEGLAFYSFYHNDQPVSYKDIKTNLNKAVKRLEEFSDPKNYKMGHISITMRDVVENVTEITSKELYEVIMAIPADQGSTLLSEIEYKTKDAKYTEKMFAEFPKIRKHFVDVLA
jgi:hypothetical protein